MRYNLYPYDAAFYATGLKQSGNRLEWDSAGGLGALIVRMPYGKSPLNEESLMDALFQLLNDSDICRLKLPSEEFTAISNDIGIRFVSATTKARDHGCRIPGGAATYTIFSYILAREECRIYRQKNDQAMIKPVYSVSMELRVRVQQVISGKKSWLGLFKKEEDAAEFYQVTFECDDKAAFADGDVAYRVHDSQIYLTQEALKRETIYIRTRIKPEFFSTNSGIRIV